MVLLQFCDNHRSTSYGAVTGKAYVALGQLIVEREAQPVRERGIENVRTLIEEGDPAQRILDCARRYHADLIVLGSRGLGDLKGLLLGSVSHKVSQLAPCSCVTVK